MIWRQRLLDKDVQPCAGDGPFLEDFYQCCFVHDCAPRRINEIGRLLHQAQPCFIQEIPALFGQCQVNGNHIGLLQEIIEGHISRLRFARALHSQGRAPGDNLHAKGAADRGHLGADLPKPQYAKSFSAQDVT